MVRQVTAPNINVSAQSGWCLKYVDDTVRAPLRQKTATLSFNVEKANGNIRTSDFPVGVWVPGYLSLTGDSGGHVFLAYNHGNGTVEIHDSEVHSGRRTPYGSLAELLAWFHNYGPTFLGWSYWCDGVQFVEDVAESVNTSTNSMPAVGSKIQLISPIVRTTYRPGTTNVVGTIHATNDQYVYIVRGYDAVYPGRIIINSASAGGNGVALALYYTSGAKIDGWKQV